MALRRVRGDGLGSTALWLLGRPHNPPADVKALFAEDGTFNVGTDGQLTIGAKPCSCGEA